jgi:hypothetical protein
VIACYKEHIMAVETRYLIAMGVFAVTAATYARTR